MKLAVMQPYFFPYIGYWQLVDAVDNFVIYDDVNYIKQGFINRNSILYNGEPMRFTLETIGASSNKLINQVRVGRNKKKLLNTIGHAYKRAPYFEPTINLIESLMMNEEENLARYVGSSIEKISSYIGLNTHFIYSSDIAKDNSLTGADKVIRICKILRSDIYCNSIGGLNIYDKMDFKKNGVDLKFIRTTPPVYKQFSHCFIPNLSIIDLLMFNERASVLDYIQDYTLI